MSTEGIGASFQQAYNTVFSTQCYDKLSEYSQVALSYPEAAINKVVDFAKDNPVTDGLSYVGGKLNEAKDWTVKHASDFTSSAKTTLAQNLLPAMVAGGCAYGAYELGVQGYEEFNKGETASGVAKMTGSAVLAGITAVVIGGSPVVQTPYAAASNWWNS